MNLDVGPQADFAPEAISAPAPIGPGIWKIVLGTPESVTPVSVRHSKPLPGRSEPDGVQEGVFPLDSGAIRFRVTARGSVIDLPFNPDEGIFGLGLQLKSHLQSGKKKHLRVNADPVADTGDSHAPVPFFCSTRGYGVYIDTARYASIYIGTHASLKKLPERVKQKHSASRFGPEEIYKNAAIGEKIVVDLPVARGVELYVFAGPTIKDAVARYNRFSGGGCLPPIWSLGNWYRTYAEHGERDVLKLTDLFAAERLPFSVIGLEPGWQSEHYPNSYAWSSHFPNPGNFIRELKRLGYHLNLWENAFIHPAASFAKAIAPYCADEPSTDGLVPDFLTPEAKAIFATPHRELVAQGVSGFKLDECDNSDFISFAWSFPEHARFPSGADGEQMHALYGIHYQHTLDDVFRAAGRRHFDLVRSSGSLAASLPYVLYSDLYTHRDFLRGMVNAGFSGLLWTPELRDACSTEDLVRRLQSAVLSPMSLINAWYIPLPPWQQVDQHLNLQGEGMREAPEATTFVREVLRLRMRLVPYLYTAFSRYRLQGLPPFRAMAMDFPEDKRCWNCDRQWMIGPDLLAAPLIAGEKSLDVYLPSGTRWREFATGRPLAGGEVHHVENTNLAEIPLYVRDGAILPLAEPVEQLSSGTEFVIRPHIYSHAAASCDLYDDDGETFAYEGGAFTFVTLEWNPQDGCALRPASSKKAFSSSRYRLGEPVLLNPAAPSSEIQQNYPGTMEPDPN